jgi:hypothetical protein
MDDRGAGVGKKTEVHGRGVGVGNSNGMIEE